MINKEILLEEKEVLEATLHDLKETGHRSDDPAVIHYEGRYEELVRILSLTERKDAPEAATSKGKAKKIILFTCIIAQIGEKENDK